MFVSESRKCSRCPGLEKELSDMKTEKETEISKLKLKHEEDKKKWDEEIAQLNVKRDALKVSKHKQRERIEKLKKKITNNKGTVKDLEDQIKKQEDQIKKLEDQIKNIRAENEKLIKLKEDQTDPKQLGQLKQQNTELSTKIEKLNERESESESEYKRLQEKLDEYINCKRRKYKVTKLCRDLRCYSVST